VQTKRVSVSRLHTRLTTRRFLAYKAQILPIADAHEPLLQLEAQPVQRKRILARKFQNFIDDMIETLRDREGYGLAAPQVHRSLRLFVTEGDVVVINPKVVQVSEQMDIDFEGCFSVPGIVGPVARPLAARVEYLNRRGQIVKQELYGHNARVYLHEFDHLRGVLLLDHWRELHQSWMMTEDEYNDLHYTDEDEINTKEDVLKALETAPLQGTPLQETPLQGSGVAVPGDPSVCTSDIPPEDPAVDAADMPHEPDFGEEHGELEITWRDFDVQSEDNVLLTAALLENEVFNPANMASR